jgi:aspartyl-tRNA(Asn)/glutamyl-tRNA(Gln) amidotransferase subunit C
MSQNPSTTIDEATVKKVAELSRLKLTDADVHRYATQLTAVLGYVEQLSAVNVEGVEPMAHPLPLSNVLREDAVTTPLPIDAVLANAPGKDGDFFTVPKVLDTGMGGG